VADVIALKVHLAQDDGTRLWYVAQSDVPGLRLEADSVHELIRKVEEAAPELVDLNRAEIAAAHGPIDVLRERDPVLRVAILG
jgi:hypothetical protein